MAGVDRLQPRQFLGVRLDRVGQLQQQPPAVGGRQPAPAGEGTTRRGHRPVHVGLAGLGHVAQLRPIVRIEVSEGCPVERIDELSVDEELFADRQA